MRTKGKILSIRIPLIDLVSCIEVCDIAGARPIGMSGYVAKTLSILLTNLREAEKLPTLSEGEAAALLMERFEDRKVGTTYNILPNLPSERSEPSFAPLSFAPISEERRSDFEQLHLPIEEGEGEPFSESDFDSSLASDIKQMQLLEEEEMLAGLMVTEHRRDDSHITLIDPATVGKVEKEAEE